MDMIEKQRVSGPKISSSNMKIETAEPIQAPGAPKNTQTSQKSKVESKKTNEFAVVHFSKTTFKPEAKSILVHNVSQASLEFIANDPKLFRKYAKANAEMISHEVNDEREQKRVSEKRLENLKQNLQNAFHSRLKNLELQRQKNHSS